MTTRKEGLVDSDAGGMECLECGARQSSVIDSRYVAKSNRIRRRRQCLKCDSRITTYEAIEAEDTLLAVVDGYVNEIQDKLSMIKAISGAVKRQKPEDPGMRDEAGGSFRKRTKIDGGRDS